MLHIAKEELDDVRLRWSEDVAAIYARAPALIREQKFAELGLRPSEREDIDPQNYHDDIREAQKQYYKDQDELEKLENRTDIDKFWDIVKNREKKIESRMEELRGSIEFHEEHYGVELNQEPAQISPTPQQEIEPEETHEKEIYDSDVDPEEEARRAEEMRRRLIEEERERMLQELNQWDKGRDNGIER